MPASQHNLNNSLLRLTLQMILGCSWQLTPAITSWNYQGSHATLTPSNHSLLLAGRLSVLLRECSSVESKLKLKCILTLALPGSAQKQQPRQVQSSEHSRFSPQQLRPLGVFPRQGGDWHQAGCWRGSSCESSAQCLPVAELMQIRPRALHFCLSFLCRSKQILLRLGTFVFSAH